MADAVRASRFDGGTSSGQRRLPAESGAAGSDELRQALWEREMRRQRVSIRVLGAVLVALVVRGIVDGVSTAVGLTGLVVAGLLVVSLILRQQGRRIEPPLRSWPDLAQGGAGH